MNRSVVIAPDPLKQSSVNKMEVSVIGLKT